MLNEAFALKTVHVPYRGLSPAFTDLLSGNIDFMVTSLTGILRYVQSGQMPALAVFGDECAEQLPTVPNAAELVLAELNISNWYWAVHVGRGSARAPTVSRKYVSEYAAKK